MKYCSTYEVCVVIPLWSDHRQNYNMLLTAIVGGKKLAQLYQLLNLWKWVFFMVFVIVAGTFLYLVRFRGNVCQINHAITSF